MTDETIPADATVLNTGEQMPAVGKAVELTEAQRLALMRAPFALADVGLLPKQLRKDDDDKGRCEDTEDGRHYSRDGLYCGGYHALSVHLSYVGHAALTNRLLELDPYWNWEPVAFDALGNPALDANGGLWMRLTVCGTTRLGYGAPARKGGPDAVKEAIGDGLRNAAMRFGAGLELWHKGDLSVEGTLIARAEAELAGAGRDWESEANQMTSVDDITALWNEAQAEGADQRTLDRITGVGTRMKRKARQGAAS